MKRILIVDDDPFITSVYHNRFQHEGYHAETASKGAVALDLVRNSAWDLVLLDLQMPDLNGVEILKSIRSDPATRHIPVIVFSNAYLNAMVEAAWAAGATRLLTKAQCSPNELVDAVRKTLAATPPAPAPKVRPAPTPGPAKPLTPPPLPVGPHPAQSTAKPEFDGDRDTQAELRVRFRLKMPAILSALRDQVQTFTRARDGEALQAQAQALSRTAHALVGGASVAGYSRIAQMSSAMEALFEELRERPGAVNMSTLRTIVHATAALAFLGEQANGAEDKNSTPLVLVVDDDTVASRAVCMALERARLNPISVNDSLMALRLMEQNHFDLVCLDVAMPEMNGVTLWTRLRALPTGHDTRVIFITAQANFEKLTRSSLFQDDEIIAKPFPPIELAVKALTCVLGDASSRARPVEPVRSRQSALYPEVEEKVEILP